MSIIKSLESSNAMSLASPVISFYMWFRNAGILSAFSTLARYWTSSFVIDVYIYTYYMISMYIYIYREREREGERERDYII